MFYLEIMSEIIISYMIKIGIFFLKVKKLQSVDQLSFVYNFSGIY